MVEHSFNHSLPNGPFYLGNDFSEVIKQAKKKKKSYEQICTLLYLFEQMLLSRPLEATIFHFRGTTI